MKQENGFNSYLAALGLALGLLVLPRVAMSQGDATGASGAAAASTQTIDDTTLQHAAKAYVAVRHIADDTKQRIARTQDSSEQQQISKQAESQKLDVVKQEGLQPSQYNQVLMTVQNDPSLQQKFLSYVNSSGNM